MSTRGIYIFKDKDGSAFHVYKHFDNYPLGACEFLVDALKKAWPLPRYEADEFACAFIAANKDCGGGVRLVPHGVTDMGQDYTYIITCPDADVFGKAKAEIMIEFEDCDEDGISYTFRGSLASMLARYRDK